MAENSFSKFFARNKLAIVATVSAGAAAVGAYVYYHQLKQQQQHHQQQLKGTKDRQRQGEALPGQDGEEELGLKEDGSCLLYTSRCV